MRALRALDRSSSSLSASFERLSTGQRINRPSDDAAGQAIAASLRTDTRVFTRAMSNIQDGISFLSVADGAITQLVTITTRHLELAAQAANGVFSSAQREALQSEATALTAEYNRIVRSTEFNGIRLFDGSASARSIQHGYGAEQSTAVRLGQFMGDPTGDGTFQSLRSFGTAGANGTNVEVGDFNGDGFDDIASSASTGTVSILLGNGDGTFKSVRTVVAPNSPTSVRAYDLNNDGILDLVTSGAPAGAMVFLGNGDGTFSSGVTVNTGTTLNGLNIVDLDNDGNEDLVTYETGGSSVGILMGRGDGTFDPVVQMNVGSSNRGMGIADLNGDGILDLTTGTGSSLRVFIGRGDGTFNPNVSYAVAGGVSLTTIGDFNGDGIADVAAADFPGNRFHILLGNGDGSFQAAQSFAVPVTGVLWIESRDLNGDGYSDISVTNSASPATAGLSVFLSNGDGSFTAAATYLAGAFVRGHEYGDFNEDGVLDVVTSDNGPVVNLRLGNQDPTRRAVIVRDIDLSSASEARDALEVANERLKGLNLEKGALGAYQARLEATLAVVGTQTLNYTAAASRITDIDVAQEVAAMVAQQTLLRVGTAVAAQANQQPRIAIRLLENAVARDRAR